MKWLEKDYVTGMWYCKGVCLDPRVWASCIAFFFVITRWFWIFVAVALAGYWLGSIT